MNNTLALSPKDIQSKVRQIVKIVYGEIEKAEGRGL